MDIRLTLVKAITLIYQDSHNDATSLRNSQELVSSALKLINIPDTGNEQRNPLSALRSTVLWLSKLNATGPINRDDLLQRIKLDTTDNESLYTAIADGLRPYENKDELLNVINSNRRQITEIINIEQLKAMLKEASHTALFKEKQITDWLGFKDDLISKIGGVDVGGGSGFDDGSFVGTVDLNNRDSLLSAFKEMRTATSIEGGLVFPWQDMNNMFGEQRVARRGEFHLYSGLPHNYKSGWLLDVFIGFCLFNMPHCYDSSKKPALILFSTEDALPVIMGKLYTRIQQWLHNYEVAVDIKSVDIETMTDVVMTTLKKNGWEVFIHHVLPSAFTYSKQISVIEDYKSRGYEISAIVFDYLSMCNKSGCNSDIIGDDIQDLFRRTREYISKERILYVTAHQLSTEAKTEKRMNEEEFIRKLPGGGYFERSKKLDTEPDFIAYLNIRMYKGRAYLEVLWGKHRKLGSTDEKDKYIVIPYLDYPMDGVPYDVGKEKVTYTVVGGKKSSEGGGHEWFDFDQ